VKERLEVTLTDLNGKVIIKREMASPAKEEIDIGKYSRGQYLLRLATGGGIKVEKVLVY